MKRILTAAILCSAVIFTSCSSTDNSNPKSVLSSFLKAMNKGDYDGAKKFATEESGKSLDMLKMMGADKMAKKDNSKMDIGEPKIDGDKATIDVKDKDGKTTPYNLKKINGAWKVAFDKNGGGDNIKTEEPKMNEEPKTDTETHDGSDTTSH